MKSMEKLELLRVSGVEQKQAEAIVRIQEDSEYVTKDFLKGELQELRNQLFLAMAVIAGLALSIAKFIG